MKSFVKFVVDNGGVVKMVKHSDVHDLRNGITNPSILKHGGKTLVTFRSPSYSFLVYREKRPDGRNISYYPQNRDNCPMSYSSYNYICELDTDTLEVSNPKTILTDFNDTRDVQYKGLEDIRMYNDGDNLCCTTSIFSNWGKVDMRINKLDSDYKVIEEKTYNIIGVEKNWMPVIGRPGVFVHTVPGVVVDTNKSDNIIIRDKDRNMLYSGSTQLVPYGDGYLCICHKRFTNDYVKYIGWGYFHKFIYWNKDLEIVSESDWFSFMGFPIEFTCGLLVEGDDVIVPFSIFDTCAFIMKFDVSIIGHLLDKSVEIKKRDFISSPLNDIIRMNNDSDMSMAMGSYITRTSNNPASRICCYSYMASVLDLHAALDLYVRCLCELKKLDMRHNNWFLHAILGEDEITSQIDKLLEATK